MQSGSAIGIWQRAGSRLVATRIGESFSDILQGLERDILRILTRTLITEPIAAGIRGGLRGEEPGAGGLEGVLNKVFGTAGVFFGEDEAEEPTITRVDSEIADAATTSLLALGEAGDTTGALLTGSLSEGAAKAGIETLTQASASTIATTQLGELAVAAASAAAALKTLAASSATGGGAGGGAGGAGGGGGLSPEQALSIFGPGPHSAGGAGGGAGAGGSLTDAQALSIFGPGPHAGGGAAEGGPASGAGAASLVGPGIFAAAALLTAVLLSKSLPLLQQEITAPFAKFGKSLTSGFGIGGLFGFAGGGPVSGPGGSRSDMVPALLSDGEFVVNAEATRRHRRLLEAVNKGNRLFGLDIFRDGGLATSGVPGIPPIRRGGSTPGPSAADLRPIINHNHFHGVSDFGSFQRNAPQFRGLMREMMSRAEKRDD